MVSLSEIEKHVLKVAEEIGHMDIEKEHLTKDGKYDLVDVERAITRLDRLGMIEKVMTTSVEYSIPLIHESGSDYVKKHLQ